MPEEGLSLCSGADHCKGDQLRKTDLGIFQGKSAPTFFYAFEKTLQNYLSTSHRKLFEQTRDEIARITYTPVCGADLAILYLSTSDELMSKHIIPLITHAKQLFWRFESTVEENDEGVCIVTPELVQAQFPQAEYFNLEGVPNMGGDVDTYLIDSFQLAQLVTSRASGAPRGSGAASMSTMTRTARCACCSLTATPT